MKKLTTTVFLFLAISLFSLNSQANWSWNVGYHNPPGAEVGINFMKLWSNWAFEAGIGSLDINSNNNNSDGDSLQIGGALSLKYLFMSGFFRPYVQGGFGTGLAIGDGASLGTGNSYLGAGAFFIGKPFYVYLSLLFENNGSTQLGIGFPF